jgi:hypothetical protein
MCGGGNAADRHAEPTTRERKHSLVYGIDKVEMA